MASAQRLLLTLHGAEFSDQLSCLENALPDASAFSFYKTAADDAAPVVIDWVFEFGAPPLNELQKHITNMAEICGVNLHGALWDLHDFDTNTDWLTASYQQFPAFYVGPFYIHGSHIDSAGAAADQMSLQIDAATAFGSGEHGTTKGCLEMMLRLKDQGACPWNVLDMGTGSGILAIAAWKLWKTPVLASDNDPECIRVTKVHAEMNKVPLSSTDLSVTCGDGFAAPDVQQKKRFDLIIANILASVLMGMASDVKSACDKNGFLILSGILEKQADDVLHVYASQGFIKRDAIVIEGWSTILLQRAD